MKWSNVHMWSATESTPSRPIWKQFAHLIKDGGHSKKLKYI